MAQTKEEEAAAAATTTTTTRNTYQHVTASCNYDVRKYILKFFTNMEEKFQQLPPFFWWYDAGTRVLIIITIIINSCRINAHAHPYTDRTGNGNEIRNTFPTHA